MEEHEQLGGKTALWSCMATDTCQNCGDCLSRALAHKIAEQDNITLHLKTKIAALKRSNQEIETRLTSGETIVTDKVIMATGFSPFDPVKLPSFHWETSPGHHYGRAQKCAIKPQGLCQKVIMAVTTVLANRIAEQTTTDTSFYGTQHKNLPFLGVEIQWSVAAFKRDGIDILSMSI